MLRAVCGTTTNRCTRALPEAAESLPTGSEQPWLCWRSLNSLHTEIGSAKTTMRRWSYNDNTQSFKCDQLANCRQWPTSSAAGYLMSFAPLRTSSLSQIGQRHMPRSVNTLCEGQGEEDQCGNGHWMVNVSTCKELWIARRKHQHAGQGKTTE